MKNGQTVWVDSGLCTGCGACVEVCPTGAMTMAAGKARVDQDACTGCGICANECAVDAIQPVFQGEMVPAIVGERAPRPYRPSPLVETAGAVAAVAGTGLVMRAAQSLGRAVFRWLARRPDAAVGSPASGASQADSGERGGGRGGRRRRRRGG